MNKYKQNYQKKNYKKIYSENYEVEIDIFEKGKELERHKNETIKYFENFEKNKFLNKEIGKNLELIGKNHNNIINKNNEGDSDIKINNSIGKNNKYIESEDEDFKGILRESITIRESQNIINKGDHNNYKNQFYVNNNIKNNIIYKDILNQINKDGDFVKEKIEIENLNKDIILNKNEIFNNNLIKEKEKINNNTNRNNLKENNNYINNIYGRQKELGLKENNIIHEKSTKIISNLNESLHNKENDNKIKNNKITNNFNDLKNRKNNNSTTSNITKIFFELNNKNDLKEEMVVKEKDIILGEGKILRQKNDKYENNNIIKENNIFINCSHKENYKNIFVKENIDKISLNPIENKEIINNKVIKKDFSNKNLDYTIDKKAIKYKNKPKQRAIIRKKPNLELNKKESHINKENEGIKEIDNIDLNSQQTRIKIINYNISKYNTLKEINFFEKIKSFSKERYSLFIKEFQQDIYFMDKSQFENVFIDEKDLNIKSPLSLIFHYIFNPKTIQAKSNKNFFETIYINRGDRNYSIEFDEKDLLQAPKFFNDLNYVNNLFNNFNKNDLILFLEEIKNWKKYFIFEQKFTYIIKQFLREKEMNMYDIASVYFISPLDLIVDYHSYGSKFPMADFFVAITQYRFHCDINFDIKKGNFDFTTSGTVLNTIKVVKKTLLEKTIINESNLTNKNEIQNNIWPHLTEVIKKEDKNNKIIIDNIFENNMKYNLRNYSTEKKREFLDLYESKENENHNKKNNYLSNDEERKDQLYNKNEEIRKKENSNKYQKNKKRKILKYGVFFVFFLYIIRIISLMIKDNISLEVIFYILIIIIIGFILIKFNIKRKKKKK